MNIRGTIIIRYMHAGSKSEGWKALLMADNLAVYQLYRPDVYPVNDEYFYPFDRKDVVVTGTIEENTFFAVDHIELNTNETLNNEQDHEEDLPPMQ